MKIYTTSKNIQRKIEKIDLESSNTFLSVKTNYFGSENHCTNINS
jgi:hypothetical protein